MRITKLHILAFFLLCALGYSAYYYRKEQSRAAEERARIEAENSLRERQEAEEAQRVAQSSPTVQAAPEPVAQTPQAVEYTVQRGDTLWKIAKEKGHFGLGHRWYDIWKANNSQIRDFDHIEAGQKIMIPLDKPEGFAWEATSDADKQRILRRARPRAAPAIPAPTN